MARCCFVVVVAAVAVKCADIAAYVVRERINPLCILRSESYAFNDPCTQKKKISRLSLALAEPQKLLFPPCFVLFCSVLFSLSFTRVKMSRATPFFLGHGCFFFVCVWLLHTSFTRSKPAKPRSAHPLNSTHRPYVSVRASMQQTDVDPQF